MNISLNMENQSERQSLRKYEMNGTGEPSVDDNDSSLRSRKKGVAMSKNQQPDMSGIKEPHYRIPEELSPYATSIPLASRLYALQNNRKYQPGMVGDRVMSAKLIKMKELENELTVLRKQLNEINAENKLLRALHHRQDHALKKFEGSKGQLPQLIKSHSEEVRALKSKCKKLSMQNRDLEKRLRNREMELRSIQEQNRHLQQLSKDRNLGERETLREEVDALKNMLQHMELQFQDVARRKAIEQRIHQQKLQQEINLNKELKKSLLSAEQNIHDLKTLLLKNEINFGLEKNPNPSKSPKEVKTLGSPSLRLPFVGQHHQTEAEEPLKESTLVSMKKISNYKQRACLSVGLKSIKPELHPRDHLKSEPKKSSQCDQSACDEGETKNVHKRLSLINTKITVQEPCSTSDDFYLSLDTNPQASSDAHDYRENTVNESFKDSGNLTVKEMDDWKEDSPKSQGTIKLEDSDHKAGDGAYDNSSRQNFKSIEAQGERGSVVMDGNGVELNRDDASLMVHGEEKIKLEESGYNLLEEGIDRSKKDKLLKALKDLDQEEWIDVETSDVEAEQELSTGSRNVKPAKKTYNLERGKINSDRSCSSGPSSAKSKKSTSLRSSAKADLMHELFGTIPKSEMKLYKKKISDPASAIFRDIKS